MSNRVALILVVFCLPLSARAGIRDLQVVQIGFAFRSDGSKDTPRVLVSWSEIGGNPQSVDILRDGELLVRLDGGSEEGPRTFELVDEPLGTYLYEVIGSDGTTAAQFQTVINSSPVGDPRNLTCASEDDGCSLSADEDDCEIIIIWDNDGPFGGSYTVTVSQAPDLVFPMDPLSSCATVSFDSPGEHDVTLFAFAEQTLSGEPGNYRSAIAQTKCLVECTLPGASTFRRGACDGLADAPTLTSAVFGLNFLFLGGDPPPCREACDADGDGDFLLNDMIYVLNFLFLGGSAPRGWIDRDGDDAPDPTCETAPLERCAETHASC